MHLGTASGPHGAGLDEKNHKQVMVLAKSLTCSCLLMFRGKFGVTLLKDARSNTFSLRIKKLFGVPGMPAQLDIDAKHRSVNINAEIFHAPGVVLVRIKLVFG